MAENSVFSNETGQVMFGSGGMIYKVPYERSNLALKPSGANYFFRVDNLNIPLSTHSISMVIRNSVGFNFRVLSVLGDNNVWYSMTSNTNGHLVYLGGSVTQTAFYNVTRYNLWRPSLNSVYVDTVPYSSSFSVPSDVNIKSFVFYGNYQGGSLLAQNGNGYFDEIRLWDRPISSEEWRALYANGNYSPPVTKQGLSCEFKMNKVEILDFSETQDGSDMRVAMRDFSGKNNHAYLFTSGTNYPAGTLQEQADYFNNNLLSIY